MTPSGRPFGPARWTGSSLRQMPPFCRPRHNGGSGTNQVFSWRRRGSAPSSRRFPSRNWESGRAKMRGGFFVYDPPDGHPKFFCPGTAVGIFVPSGGGHLWNGPVEGKGGGPGAPFERPRDAEDGRTQIEGGNSFGRGRSDASPEAAPAFDGAQFVYLPGVWDLFARALD